MGTIERYVVGLLAAAAVATFFYPLIEFTVPIAGTQRFSGYDLVSQRSEFAEQINAPLKQQSSARTAGKADRTVWSAIEEPADDLDIPASISYLMVVPIFITAAYLCAVITLVAAVLSARTKKTAVFGALLGVASCLHLRIASSDMHSYLKSQMSALQVDMKDNPFASIASGFADLMVSAFELHPGAGLYTLTGTLIICGVVLHTGLLSQVHAVGDRGRP